MCAAELYQEGCRRNLGGIEKVQRTWDVNHTHRSGNNAAHILAGQAKFLNECSI